MIRPEMIPDEVVEALLAHLNTCECRECTAETIAAALNAWPGAIINTPDEGTFVCRYGFVLPLPEAPQERGVSTENSDE